MPAFRLQTSDDDYRIVGPDGEGDEDDPVEYEYPASLRIEKGANKGLYFALVCDPDDPDQLMIYKAGDPVPVEVEEMEFDEVGDDGYGDEWGGDEGDGDEGDEDKEDDSEVPLEPGVVEPLEDEEDDADDAEEFEEWDEAKKSGQKA